LWLGKPALDTQDQFIAGVVALELVDLQRLARPCVAIASPQIAERRFVEYCALCIDGILDDVMRMPRGLHFFA
jgi:hypothetical protein